MTSTSVDEVVERARARRRSSSARMRATSVLLLALELHEVVVGLDDALGLHEERLPALRAVVDDAAHAARAPPPARGPRSGRGAR